MWIWFVVSDFFRGARRAEENLSPNGKEDARKGYIAIIVIIALGYAVYYSRVGFCYLSTKELRSCQHFTAEQIREAKDEGKFLPFIKDDISNTDKTKTNPKGTTK